MNNHQTLLVQKSSQQSIPIAEQVALLFYDRLVAPNPPLSTDSNRQEKIMIQKRNPAITFFIVILPCISLLTIFVLLSNMG